MRRTPLVGRETELAALRAVFHGDAARGVVLSGETGAGKTRLLHAAADLARTAGRRVVHIPVTRAAAALPLAAAAALLPDAPVDPSADPIGFYRTAAAQLRRREPVTALVDDAHLLDAASAALLAHLVAEGALRVVVTVHAFQPRPDAVTALWKDGWAERRDLGPLDREDVARLVAAVFEDPVDGAVAYRFWHLSRGNPFAAVELLDQALAGGALRLVRGRWQQVGPLLPSRRLQETVGVWLGRLGPAAAEAAQVVALAEPLGLALAGQVVDRAAIAEAEDKGVVSVVQNRRRVELQVAHPMAAAVLRDGAGRLRRQLLLGGLADALGTTDLRRRRDRTTLALWRLDAGQAVPADLLVAGARAARSQADHATARRLAQAALDTGGGAFARHLVEQMRLWEGAVDRTPPETVAQPGLAPADEAQVLVGRAAALFIGEGRPEAAEALLRAAEERLGDHVGGDVAALRAAIALSRGDVRRALRAVEAAQDTAIPAAERVSVGAVGVAALTRAGRPESALRLAERAGAAAPPGTDPFNHVVLGIVHATALAAAGRSGEGERVARTGYEAALGAVAEDEHASWRGAWASCLGQLLLGTGRVREASAWLGEAAALMAATVAVLGPAAHARCLGALAEAHALLGEADAAERTLSEADAVTPEGGVVVELALARAWTAVARGEVTAGRARATAAAERAGGLGAHALEVRALHDVARLGDPRAALRRVTAVAVALEGPVAAARVTHTQALVAGDGAGLEAASAALEAAGLLLCAAEAASQAAGAHRRTGRRARALDLLARADRLAERCGRPSTPDLVLANRELPLTRRELEIASLAAAGHSSRVIAERLVISIRTVDNHLHHVYTKLGIRDRETLAAVLGAHAAPGRA